MRRRAVASTAPQIRANGGLVWPAGGGGVVEVVLVHRPAYEDEQVLDDFRRWGRIR